MQSPYAAWKNAAVPHPRWLNRSETKKMILLSFHRFPRNEKERSKWWEVITHQHLIKSIVKWLVTGALNRVAWLTREARTRKWSRAKVHHHSQELSTKEMLMEVMVEIYYLTWYTVHGAKKVQKSSINQLDSGVFCGQTKEEKGQFLWKLVKRMTLDFPCRHTRPGQQHMSIL